MMIGKALTDILKDKTKVKGEAAFIAMERHAGCREGGKDIRAVRFVRRSISMSGTLILIAGRLDLPNENIAFVIFATEKWIHLRLKR